MACIVDDMSPISSRTEFPVRLAKPAGPIARGPGESAFDMAEQFRLQQVSGNRRGIDRSERPPLSLAMLVKSARHQFLAGARFSQD